jgi:hypothetical protein
MIVLIDNSLSFRAAFLVVWEEFPLLQLSDCHVESCAG